MRPSFHRDVGSIQFFISFVGEDDRLRREVFYLAYHLHWSVWDILDLPTEDRWAYAALPYEDKELFSRVRTGPYLEIYQLEQNS